MTGTYVALLRGINVGGKNKLPMKDLCAMFVAAGCSDVRSYIQSGNVLFRASVERAESLPAEISAAIDERFGLRVPVVVRSQEDLDAVVTGNPFPMEAGEEKSLHVFFLADTPSPERVALLDPDRSPPDQFAVRGRDVYLRLANGVADTRFTNAYFDATLKTVSTGRNWRTVTTLQRMMRE